MQAHVAHRADDRADDNVCQFGSLAIKWLAKSHEPSKATFLDAGAEPSKAKFIGTGAEQLLKSIRADAGTSEAVKDRAGNALKALGLQL